MPANLEEYLLYRTMLRLGSHNQATISKDIGQSDETLINQIITARRRSLALLIDHVTLMRWRMLFAPLFP